ncbi:DUF3467 domain-containing protein [Coprobacter tertius]|uniref:DUF3467 domain-containing protein n=1 Tax=Coprobacter tertius TaxID=2944915 RepID=A0ABT1MEJ0_9BACT|nr:DUF3467 domain-containing protein [Coprobacter tertius]MCP9610479.1 DUF3467 domain-containing protein [Coprobacter tertius]
MNNEKNQVQIELSAEVAEGIYSNLAIISHSSSEFVIDFVRLMPGIPKAPVKSRIILTPEHAKRLMFAIEENILKYEKQFGTIRTNDDSAAIPPFMAPGGQA